MIRRDYILRQVQQMAQMLARALSLRARGEYDAALREIGEALRQADPGGSGDESRLDADGWIELCRRHEGVTGPMMQAVGDLLGERAAALAAMERPADAWRERDKALALHLESLLTGSVPVTRERLEQLEGDLQKTPVEALSPATLARLATYHEERGRWAAAEDMLFEWLGRGGVAAEAARAAARGFYARLRQKPAADLAEGGLTPEEIEDGLADLERGQK